MNKTSLYAIQYPGGDFYPGGTSLNRAMLFSLVSSAKGILTKERNRHKRWELHGEFSAKIVKADVVIDPSWSNV